MDAPANVGCVTRYAPDHRRMIKHWWVTSYPPYRCGLVEAGGYCLTRTVQGRKPSFERHRDVLKRVLVVNTAALAPPPVKFDETAIKWSAIDWTLCAIDRTRARIMNSYPGPDIWDSDSRPAKELLAEF